jgi:SnoaL-like domain
MQTLESKLQRLIDKAEIQDQLYRWCRGVGRKDWELVRSIFHADAHDDHGTFNASADDFIRWQQRHHVGIDQSAHLLSNILIEFASPDVALVESYVVAYHHYTSAAQQAHTDILGDKGAAVGEFNSRGVGRYLDRFEKRGGPWRITKRTTLFETFRLDQLGDRCLQPHWLASQRDETDELVSFRKELTSKSSNL